MRHSFVTRGMDGRGWPRKAMAVALLVALAAAAYAILAGPPLRELASRLYAKVGLHHVSSPADIKAYVRRHGIAPEHRATRRPVAGPLRRSTENPRYFAGPDGRIVFLAGAHTWLNMHDGGKTDPPEPFDYEGWLDFLDAHGHNFFRLWAWEQARWSVEDPADFHFAPLPYERARGAPLALDGKPRFDLTRFDEAHLKRLRERVVRAGQRGFYVAVMLFNGWSVAYPKGNDRHANPWRGHPFNGANNVQGLDGDADGNGSGEELHELRDPRITRLQEAYVRRVVDTVNDLDNVVFEISNESHVGAAAWQNHMVDFIHAYEAGKPKRHPVGMTSMFPEGDNAVLASSNADWISPKGHLHLRPAATGNQVIVTDTDHLCGICGDRAWVWASFTRGENLLFMDRYDGGLPLANWPAYDLYEPRYVDVRRNLGFALRLAERIDLASMQPRGELASTGYALAHAAARNGEYVVYFPKGGTAQVDLRATPGGLAVEWIDPATGQVRPGSNISGGEVRSFTAPFNADAVLHLDGRGGR